MSTHTAPLSDKQQSETKHDDVSISFHHHGNNIQLTHVHNNKMNLVNVKPNGTQNVNNPYPDKHSKLRLQLKGKKDQVRLKHKQFILPFINSNISKF